MRTSLALCFALSLGLPSAACQRQSQTDVPAKGSDPGSAAGVGNGAAGTRVGPARAKLDPIPPPVDLKNPPADAIHTPSGLIYKKLVTNDAGTSPKRNDTVMIQYAGWRQASGETFYTTRTRGTPMPLNLATTAPGFTEAMQLLKTGEKAVLWLPPSIGYKGTPQGTPETLVYEVEVVDITPAPPVPPDVASPPANAESLPSGIKYVVLRPGTGKDKAKPYDTVTFNFTGWDADGRMFDTTEMRKRPAAMPPFREAPGMEQILTSMTAGERVRLWAPADLMKTTAKATTTVPAGQLCYEIEVLQIAKGVEPPAVPADVAHPPPDAKKTTKGVFYKLLKPGKGGPHPTANDTVRVNYTGWTTDGKMFDSSVTRNEPAEFSLHGVIMGWTDGIPMMSVGDKMRFWIPEELAYKGAPGRPQGMLVFDVELLEIKPAVAHP
jgi:peptidylprolyl isomerase